MKNCPMYPVVIAIDAEIEILRYSKQEYLKLREKLEREHSRVAVRVLADTDRHLTEIENHLIHNLTLHVEVMVKCGNSCKSLCYPNPLQLGDIIACKD